MDVRYLDALGAGLSAANRLILSRSTPSAGNILFWDRLHRAGQPNRRLRPRAIRGPVGSVCVAETRLARSLASIAAACLLAVATPYAYFRAFAFFSGNDDEGYILQSIRSYLDGRLLFDEIFTQYGPAFFVLESVVHQTFRAPLTHDFERFATVAMWVGASAACAATVQRITRSWIAAGLTFVGVFVHLTPLIGEPGHPQGPLIFIIALVALVAAWDNGEEVSSRRAAVAGVLTAVALLVKVNVGAYLALGFAVPLLLASAPHINPLLLAILTVAACALPLAVTRNHVRGWAFNYALIVCVSLASTVVVIAWPRRATASSGIVLRYAAVAGLACALLLLPALLRGTSAAALLTGIVLRPSQFDRIFFLPLILPATGLLAAGAGFALSVAWVLWLRTRGTPPSLVVALAKILVAAAGLYLVRIGYGYQLAWFTPFLWVVAVPPGVAPASALPVGRSILALVAVYQSLQAYPVAGSQLAFATLLMIPIAFVCAHDAFAILERHLPGSRMLSWAFQASFILAGALFYRPLLGPLPWRAAYNVGYELRLEGAERLRLPAPDVARYQWLSGTVAANCRRAADAARAVQLQRLVRRPARQRQQRHDVDDAIVRDGTGVALESGRRGEPRLRDLQPGARRELARRQARRDASGAPRVDGALPSDRGGRRLSPAHARR